MTKVRRVKKTRKPVEKESTFLETGKVFSAKLPPKLTARVEAAMEEHEFHSNSEFLKWVIRMSLPILEDLAKGRELYCKDKETGKVREYKILG